jgi:hypothetical protein
VATTYLRRLTAGKTRPAVFRCEHENGDPAGEFVVKFKSGVNSDVTGLTCELVAALATQLLGIPTPEPGLIIIDAALAGVLPGSDAEVARAIRKSAGLNFGTRLLTGGFRTWPIDMAIPLSLFQVAGEIFAFDALIQNPDRRYDNPNVLTRGEEIFAIDHESAFSFIYAIGQLGPAWKVADAGFLESHVFYKGLKGRRIEIDRFADALSTMSDDKILGVAATIPTEWKTERLTKILDHLRVVRDHAKEFADEVRRRLA